MDKDNIRIKDIAKKAGVSPGTVDRVLHDRGGVKEKTKIKILDLLKESGYQPNLMARALISKKEYTIAVLIPKRSTENVFWKKILDGIIRAENEVKAFNFKLEFFLFELYDEEDYVQQIKKIIDLNPQGVVIKPSFEDEAKLFTDRLNEKKIPYVFINSDLKSENRIRYIGQDSYATGYLGAKLLHYGIKRKGTILIVNNAKNIENYNHFFERNRGFIDYFDEHNMGYDYLLLKKKIFDDFELTVQKIFTEHDDIVGIYFSNVKSFLMARYLEKINRKDIILIGYDAIGENIKYIESGYIDFVISQNPYKQGYFSIIELFNYIAKGERNSEDLLMPMDILTKENLKYYS